MSNRLERGYTPQDVKALDNVLTDGLETILTNVEEGEIEYPKAIPEDAKCHNSTRPENQKLLCRI